MRDLRKSPISAIVFHAIHGQFSIEGFVTVGYISSSISRVQEDAITHLPLHLLEERRKAGLSPKGGPLPEERFEKLVGKTAAAEMTGGERKQELHDILGASWDHPGDARLWRRMYDLIGKDVPLAHLHIAADYVHRIEKDPSTILQGCDIYDELMNLAKNR